MPQDLEIEPIRIQQETYRKVRRPKGTRKEKEEERNRKDHRQEQEDQRMTHNILNLFKGRKKQELKKEERKTDER